jgi:hypothetical protein
MSCPGDPAAYLSRRIGLALLAAILCQPTFAQTNADAEKLIEQAERLAWLKAWTRAAPLYAEAERLYTGAAIGAMLCTLKSTPCAGSSLDCQYLKSRSA